MSNKDGRIYDRFRNRVMFPIIDIRGDVIGFGGRVMDDSTPKYLNSPDTPVYNKSRNVFALNIAKKSKAGRVILTEGYMDTISLHQAGFDSAVASLGTSLTAEHAQLLARYFKEAVIAYDGDGAGIVRRPAGHPPAGEGGAECAGAPGEGGQGPGRVHQELRARGLRPSAGQEREPDRLPAGAAAGPSMTWSDDSQRVAFLQEAAGVIATLPSAVEREIYGGHAAQTAGISAEAMAQEVKKALPPPHAQKEQKQQERRDLSPAIQLQPKASGGCATTTSAPPGRRRG